MERPRIKRTCELIARPSGDVLVLRPGEDSDLTIERPDDAADDERVPGRELARYDRQLRYFSDLSTDGVPPSERQARLREARVVMLGVGGLGSRASYALACCGVG